MPDTDPSDIESLPPPPGFHALPIDIGFIGVNGPLFVKPEEGQLRLGMRIEMRHCNPMRIAHGGLLATFIDMLMPFAIMYQGGLSGRFMPTIHLAQEYLAPAPLGCWLEGTGDLLRATRNLAFAQCLVTADGQPCLRASGIFKLGPESGNHGLMAMLECMKDGPK